MDYILPIISALCTETAKSRTFALTNFREAEKSQNIWNKLS